MNNKALTMSLVMAALAVFFVQSYVESIEEEARKKFGTEVLVIKAKKDIKEQETLNETMLEFDKLPKRFLEPNAISFEKKEADPETLKSLKSLVGAVAVVPIRKGEQITYNKLTEPSVRTGLAPQVAPGKRAFALPVTDTSGVSKLLKPGDRIDVIAVIDMGGGRENKIAKTVLQDAIVVSVGRSVTNNAPRLVEVDPFTGKERVKSLTEDTNFSTISVEVEPTQAQALALILGSGDNQIFVSLRNNDDSDRVTVPAATVGDVLGADSARAQRRIAGQR